MTTGETPKVPSIADSSTPMQTIETGPIADLPPSSGKLKEEKPGSGVFALFDGPVRDPVPRDAPEKGGGAKKGKPTDVIGEQKVVDGTPIASSRGPTEAQLEQARGLIRIGNALQVAGVQRRCELMELEAGDTARHVKAMTFTTEEVDSMAEPLAEGLAKEGVSLPWEARLALAVGTVYWFRQKPIMDSLTRAEQEKRESAESLKAADARA